MKDVTWGGPNISGELSNLLGGVDTQSGNIGTFCHVNEDIPTNLPITNSEKQRQFKPDPYGAFNCDMFAVLKKPGVNPLTFRGTTNDISLPEWQKVDDSNEVCRFYNCDTEKTSTLCSLDNGQCLNSAPGGLADFMGKPKDYEIKGGILERYMANQIENSNKSISSEYENPIQIVGEYSYLKNGFIMEGCECDYETNRFNRIGIPGDPGGIYVDNLDLNTPMLDLPSEIWNGKLERDAVGGLKNHTCETLTDNNSCQTYIKKLAHTCNWCKNANLLVPNDMPGTNNSCVSGPGNIDTFGDCFGTGSNGKSRISCIPIDSNDPSTHTEGRCSVNRYWKPDETGDCNICDSEFWNYIPGGWKAIVNETDPLHEWAMDAYSNKNQDVKDDQCCKQPAGKFLKDNLEGFVDTVIKDNCAIDETCPIGSDVYYGDDCTQDSTSYCGRNSATSLNILTNPNVVEWPQNSCNELCTKCSIMDWNSVITTDTKGHGILNRITDNFDYLNPNNEVSNLQVCPRDIQRSSKAHQMCKRSSNLTLKGKSYEENANLVKWWTEGSFEGKKQNVSKDELKSRNIKAMRCCLGASPGFKTVDKDSPNPDYLDVTERWTRDECPAGSVCPTSDFCKDLYKEVMTGNNPNITMDLNDFGTPDYPDTFKLENINDSNVSVTKETMENPAWYAKAYCELMGGGKELASGSKGLDDEINTLCRKTMYDYCVNPVEVEVSSQEAEKYALDKYTLPLNIFSEGCYRWFTGGLKDALPSDYGTRDMALGSSCQKMQIDGWIKPTEPQNSPLISAFTTTNDSGDQVITDTSGREIKINFHPHSDGSENISRSCSCFYTGTSCAGGNCSYYYCGAGADFDPTNIEIDFGVGSQESFGNVDNIFQQTVNLNPYIDGKTWTAYQEREAPAWQGGPGSGIDMNNFTCVKTSPTLPGVNVNQGTDAIDNTDGYSGCYRDCNYVNSYDVCWNASPKERKYSTLDENWDCDPDDPGGDSCTRYAEDSYGCFGPCPIGQDGLPNCGTDSWFSEPVDRKAITPNEGNNQYKNDDEPLKAADYPAWQNFYSNENLVRAAVPGWGIVNTKNDNRGSFGMCNSETDTFAIKPYGIKFSGPTSCSVNQSTTVNNNGVIVGSINISQLGECNLEGDLAAFQSDSGQRQDFLQYMGSMTCSGSGCDVKENEICINSETGDNCSWCGNNPDTEVASSPDKPNTCCLVPDLVPTDRQSDDIQIVGNKVSYICWNTDDLGNTCPPGTVDLNDLEAQCSSPCIDRTQGDCSGCPYCHWSEELGVCRGSCPEAPKEGWNGWTLPPTQGPTQSPTQGPTEPPSTNEPSTGGSGSVKEWNDYTELEKAGIIVGPIIGFILLILLIVYVIRPAIKNSKSVNESHRFF